MALVRSGWLQRQSTILRRWKRNWFDLWSDGSLVFFEDLRRQDVEDKIHMALECIGICLGSQCRGFKPPDGKTQESLLQIVSGDGAINICAESPDDAKAWAKVLEDARVNTFLRCPQAGFAEDGSASPPPPYSEYPLGMQLWDYHLYGDYGPPPPKGAPVRHHQDTGMSPGVRRIMVQERRYDDREDWALGMLTGAATGMALGSLFSVF
uniref:Otolith matrix protein n=1 Tax=Paramormyrops kingsleyae TaxID=1676925 RepID=A0A3B3T1K0_9TELE